MSDTIRITGLILGTFVLCGCSTTAPVGLNQAEFGNAVRQNAIVQAVNPAGSADSTPIELNAERAAAAQERYITDQVEPPRDISSTSIAGAGGGGGGGGGGAGGGGGN
jgi:hypothetical protein